MVVEVELVEVELVELELLLDIVTISIRCVIYYIAICCQYTVGFIDVSSATYRQHIVCIT